MGGVMLEEHACERNGLAAAGLLAPAPYTNAQGRRSFFSWDPTLPFPGQHRDALRYKISEEIPRSGPANEVVAGRNC